MKLYSWKDIDRLLQLNYEKWVSQINTIDVFPSSIVVGVTDVSAATLAIEPMFSDIFGNNYNRSKQQIVLDIGNDAIPIVVEENINTNKKAILPLFSNVLYRDSSYPTEELVDISKCPVIAFHSYKGGVGRTLSMLAFTKAWSNVFSESENNKLLIIDADIEAPGLTWLYEDGMEDTLSYLDLLSLVQDHNQIGEIVDLCKSKTGYATIQIETTTQKIEHYFIPSYRYKEQFLDMYANPATITNGRNKEYALAEVLSKLGKKLGASAVLVDLRAGVSEYSSTLLFDPRVKKYIVTSTSTQAIRGTKLLLDYLTRGLNITSDTILPEIFLNMVPPNMDDKVKESIYSELSSAYNQDNQQDNYVDNIITSLAFASELIHLSSLEDTFEQLNDRSMYQTILRLIEQNYTSNDDVVIHAAELGNREETLKLIFELADQQITAEGNKEFDLLMTAPLRNLKKKYSSNIPNAVIMGAKGSGKTFLYRKLLESRTWQKFCDDMETPDGIVFVPVIAAKNSNELTRLMQANTVFLNQQIKDADVQNGIYLDNATALSNFNKSVHTEEEWFDFWCKTIATTISPGINSLEMVNDILSTENRKVVYIIDGIEEVLTETATSDSQKMAISSLCQNVVTQITVKYPNIGILVFLRRDMARDAIVVNFAQFEQNYRPLELKWSTAEALRLVVWLVSQAVPSFYQDPIDLSVASQEIIDKYLLELWGAKLGKPTSNEAYSSRWILAALSDFNGQLQARDIIRFLKYATQFPGKNTYPERLIMPTEVKSAVAQSSTEKVDEVKQEISGLKPILDKLESASPDVKTLPFTKANIDLTPIEEELMEREGFLIRDGDKYYLPEIIRHSLGFRYEKGGRSKVLSLLLKHS